MSRPSRDAPPPLDIDVPAIPLSAILRYRHRRHQKAMALGYGIAVVMIVMNFLADVLYGVLDPRVSHERR